MNIHIIKHYSQFILFLVLSLFSLNINAVEAQKTNKTLNYVKLKDLVKKPAAYKNQKLTVKGKFYSFSSLPLDYKPAFRDSKDYIGLVLSRPDQEKVPLVELKIANKLDYFKKKKDDKDSAKDDEPEEITLNLNHGDLIEIDAEVFAIALGEPWLEASDIRIIKKAKEEDKE